MFRSSDNTVWRPSSVRFYHRTQYEQSSYSLSWYLWLEWGKVSHSNLYLLYYLYSHSHLHPLLFHYTFFICIIQQNLFFHGFVSISHTLISIFNGFIPYLRDDISHSLCLSLSHTHTHKLPLLSNIFQVITLFIYTWV